MKPTIPTLALIGAASAQVVKAMLFDGMRPVLLGVLIGLFGALGFSRMFLIAFLRSPCGQSRIRIIA